jgi:AAA15 family ATPase/GTPase
LIAGKNNIGKSALLEALWMHHGYQNPQLGVRVDAFRGLTIVKEDEVMTNIFKEFDQNKDIIITSINEKKQKAKLTISKTESPIITVPADIDKYKRESKKVIPLNAELSTSESMSISRPEIHFEYSIGPKKIESKAYFDKEEIKFEMASKIKKSLGIYLASGIKESPQMIAERYGELEINKSEADVIQILKIIEPDLQKLIIIHRGGVPLLYGDIGKEKMIPLQLMGDGMVRLLGIALSITATTDGIVLIDEIENGLHHTVINNVWKAIAQLSRKYRTQVFATTHSRECIQSAFEVFSKDKKYDFLLHRLELVRGKITNFVYDKKTLEAAIKSEFEIR